MRMVHKMLFIGLKMCVSSSLFTRKTPNPLKTSKNLKTLKNLNDLKTIPQKTIAKITKNVFEKN